MENTDTVKLLQECDSGSKMAVSAIDELFDKTTNKDLREIMSKSKNHHAKLGNEIHSILLQHSSDEKDPNPMAKGMAWFTTNMKFGMDKSDATVADILTDGCNMGIKSLNRFLNQYAVADEQSTGICNKLIDIEYQFAQDLKKYL